MLCREIWASPILSSQAGQPHNLIKRHGLFGKSRIHGHARTSRLLRRPRTNWLREPYTWDTEQPAVERNTGRYSTWRLVEVKIMVWRRFVARCTCISSSPSPIDRSSSRVSRMRMTPYSHESERSSVVVGRHAKNTSSDDPH
jgi:hypothetical protein